MCIRDSLEARNAVDAACEDFLDEGRIEVRLESGHFFGIVPVSYTHLRAHETVLDLVCRLLLEKKKKVKTTLSVRKSLDNKIKAPYTYSCDYTHISVYTFM